MATNAFMMYPPRRWSTFANVAFRLKLARAIRAGRCQCEALYPRPSGWRGGAEMTRPAP